MSWKAFRHLVAVGAFTIGCGHKPAPPCEPVSTSSQLDKEPGADELLRTLAAIDQAERVTRHNVSNAKAPAYWAQIPTVQNAAVRVVLDTEQGSLENTNNPLDLAIQGPGFFVVKFRDGAAYTRNGNFFVNSRGQLVLGVGDGCTLIPPVTFPAGTDSGTISVSEDGLIQFIPKGSSTRQAAGQFVLAQFPCPQFLKQLPNGLLIGTAESGEPSQNKPTEGGAGTVLQNFLEASNVDPIREQYRLDALHEWRDTIRAALFQRPAYP